MKNKSIIVFAYLILVSNMSCALGVKIENISNDPAAIELVFTGNPRGWTLLSAEEGFVSLPLEYKTALHHLRYLYIRYSDGKVYGYDLGKYELRGTGKMEIRVNGSLRVPGRAILLTGYRDIVRKAATSFEIAVNGGVIENWVDKK